MNYLLDIGFQENSFGSWELCLCHFRSVMFTIYRLKNSAFLVQWIFRQNKIRIKHVEEICNAQKFDKYNSTKSWAYFAPDDELVFHPKPKNFCKRTWRKWPWRRIKKRICLLLSSKSFVGSSRDTDAFIE